LFFITILLYTLILLIHIAASNAATDDVTN